MNRWVWLLLVWLVSARGALGADVLMVADEIPAMEVLAHHLQQTAQVTSRIVTQTNLPAELSEYATIVVYIHRALSETTEAALIHYTTNGGKLLVLHHSISSGKRQNKQWFGFLGVALPPGSLAEGGYKWIESVSLDIINLDPLHFVTTNQCRYDRHVEFADASNVSRESARNGFHLEETEVYLNHQLAEGKTLLLGFKYTDAATGKTFIQKRAGWYNRVGKGQLYYFMPGHSAKDFEHPVYRQILLNSILYRPEAVGHN